MEVDLRSADSAPLRALEKRSRQAVDERSTQEKRGGAARQLTVTIEVVGHAAGRPRSPTAPIVQAAVSVSRALNLPLSFSEGPPMRTCR